MIFHLHALCTLVAYDVLAVKVPYARIGSLSLQHNVFDIKLTSSHSVDSCSSFLNVLH